MSYPYPQDRRRDQRTKGEEPYRDAREAMSENEAEIEEDASRLRDSSRHLTDEEQTELQEQAAEERFRNIGEEER